MSTRLFWKDENMEAAYTCAELAGIGVYELTNSLGDELNPHQKLQIIDNARQMVKGHGELETREFQRVCNLIYRVGIASLAYDRLNEEDCNYGDVDGDRYAGLDRYLRELTTQLSFYVSSLRFSGDPRGCSVNMRLTNGEWNTLGREFAASWYCFDLYNWNRLYHYEIMLADWIAEGLCDTDFSSETTFVEDAVKDLLAALHEYRFLFVRLTEEIDAAASGEVRRCIKNACRRLHYDERVNSLIGSIRFGRDADTHNWITAELAYGDWNKTIVLN